MQKKTNIKHELKRKKILFESRKLFGTYGFEGTSVKDIANACDCAQSNIYLYFLNKEEILYEVLHGEITQLLALIQPLDNDSTINPVDQFKIFIKNHVKHSLDETDSKLLYFEAEVKYLQPSQRGKIIELRDRYDKIIRQIIRRGIEAGLFDKFHEKVINYAVASTIVRARLWFSPRGELSSDGLAEEISNLFLRGILLRDGIVSQNTPAQTNIQEAK